jgi:hypothetical protein
MQRLALFAALGLCAALAIAQTGPGRAGEIDTQLFGSDPGEARAAACFVRHYDTAHLVSHPQQNVTDMLVLVDGQPDGEEGRNYVVNMGVKFRGLDTQMAASGYCGSVQSGDEVLSCGIDCDGGIIGVRLSDANTVMIDLPQGAATWNPAADLALDDVEQPPEAQFGDDDKTFRLERTALSQCTDIVFDDDLKAIVAAK